MERDSFIFRKKWYEAIESNLPAEMQAEAFNAICQFALYHKQIEVSPMVKLAMAFIMPELVAECEKWLDIREKRIEAGKKGGAPKGNKNASKQPNQANDCFAIVSDDDSTKNNQNQAEQAKQAIATIFSSSINNNNFSFFSHMCAGSEEKKEAFLFEIGKEMLRKGAAKPSKETDLFIAYNDSQGWLLKNGRNISDPVAWAKNWSIKNPSDAIFRSAEAYILLLRGANITDRKMLDALKEIAVTGNQIAIKLSSKKAAEAFVKAEDSHLESMRTAIEMAFPEIQNPQIQYLSPRA